MQKRGERRPKWAGRRGVWAGLAALLLATTGTAGVSAWAQEDAEATGEYRRAVLLPAGARPAVVVSEFFSHGALEAAGTDLWVTDGKGQAAAWRELQRGPGDLVRVAFQPMAGGTSPYEIHYGSGKPAGMTAAGEGWANDRPGLLFTAYRWRDCDLNRIESVREAIAGAEPIGSDYVPTVYHRFNPVDPAPERFLSRYEGVLLVPAAGRYAFFTTSQDASFLSIDGQVVVESPGWHGPTGDARFKGEVNLTAGPHAFEYLHACAGPDTCMVAAWQPPGAEKPEPIPPVAFGSNLVLRQVAGPPVEGENHRLGDMAVAVLGEVPVLESPDPLVRVQFVYRGASGSGGGSRVRWDFGDGQTGQGSEPTHVYLHPGVYLISVQQGTGGGSGPKLSNRVPIGRAIVPDDPKQATPDALGSYLALVETYDVGGLDPRGAVQLARVYEQIGRNEALGKLATTWLASPRAVEDEGASEELLELVVPRLRDGVGDAKGAMELCRSAAGVYQDAGRRRDALARAADIALNDLLESGSDVGEWVAEASRLEAAAGGPSSLSLRVQGDWNARRGDRAGARRAYTAAQRVRDQSRNASEQLAWRGAYSRSVESFLSEGRIDEALAEMRLWIESAPLDRLDGDLPLLLAKLWGQRQEYDRAIQVAADLIAANPDSAYADQLLMVAAEAERRANRPDRAKARLQAIVTDYPGSPLVSEARRQLEEAP